VLASTAMGAKGRWFTVGAVCSPLGRLPTPARVRDSLKVPSGLTPVHRTGKPCTVRGNTSRAARPPVLHVETTLHLPKVVNARLTGARQGLQQPWSLVRGLVFRAGTVSTARCAPPC